jgi:hypothetical protein
MKNNKTIHYSTSLWLTPKDGNYSAILKEKVIHNYDH